MDKLEERLKRQKEKNAYRTLKINSNELIDFSSNDYLGLARSTTLKELILKAYQESDEANGSTGSRLITGHNALLKNLEQQLAELFHQETTLLFNSGYMANLAFFSSVPQRGDTVIYDELSHACIKDGCRLSVAKRLSFRHNSLEDLEKKLKATEGEIYVVCESVYSMDGDMAPLHELTKLCKQYNAKLIVDEAHSTGIWGEDGYGLVNDLGLAKQVFAVIYTFGKGMGIHGAAIASSSIVKSYLINFARPFIYTTAPSAHEILSVKKAFEYLKVHPSLALNLFSKIELFNKHLPDFTTPSPIKSIPIGGNSRTKKIAHNLQAFGFDVRPILSPTVKEGSERLRICLHAFNSDEEIVLLCERLKGLMS